MKDYKDTLNLPQTSFPMKANLPQREPEILKRWAELNLYERLMQQGTGREQHFIVHDGPPYANGQIHLGTAMNKILKDIVVKSKWLGGYAAPYVPGWDCHGLPIELNVEKRVGKAGAKLTPAEFREACREYAQSQVELQSEDFQRLGVIGDWANPYLTMHFRYEANAVRALAKIVENGHLMRGQKPVHWCTSCASALAEAEVEYRDKTSPAIDVSFYAHNPESIVECFGSDVETDVLIVPIWTTTPWTLPANQAVCLHPDISYVLVECDLHGQTIHLVLAEELLDTVMQRYQAEDYQIIAKAKGEKLSGQLLEHPFMNRIVPVIVGEHVTVDAGTGCVHTAPAHGQDDYVVGQKFHLEIDNPVDSRSCFIEEIPVVGGQHVFKANDPIIEMLGKSGHLLCSETIEHSYPHCWRHKTPLIFRATQQWFISMEQQRLREKALKAIDNIQWLPAWGKTRISKMIESRPDWCISRQRTWGIPLPLFTHKATGELHPETVALMEKVAERIEAEGVDAWFELDAAELIGDDVENYDKVNDILDVWFDSGISHYCVLEQRDELSWPADLYLEGSDQHRGWFQTSLLTALAIHGKPPYHKVLTHGFVVDAKGHKMSKSLGNTVLPMEVIKQKGGDILRLWAASSDHTGEVAFSLEILQRSSEAYRRIRNTARFLLSNLHDFDPKQDLVPGHKLLVLDQWAIDTTKRLQEKIVHDFERYRFQSVFQLIHNFCAIEMGSFYLDIIKDRQYTARANGLPRRSSQTAMYYIIETLTRWIAPILSFTAEEIWQYIPGERVESVFLDTWFVEFPELVTEKIDPDYWQCIMAVRDEVNRVLEERRSNGDIGSALDAQVTLYCEQSLFDCLSALEDELRFILITSDADVKHEKDKPASVRQSNVDGLWVQVDVSQHEKCVRCWQRRDDVGSNKEYDGLCGRCVENIAGQGEVRKYA